MRCFFNLLKIRNLKVMQLFCLLFVKNLPINVLHMFTVPDLLNSC